MALVHRESPLAEWPTVWLPDRWRDLFELGDAAEWLRVEEFHEGDSLVVRAELPDVDPEEDVEVTTVDGMVRIHAQRQQSSERKNKQGYRSEFRYGEFERDIALPKGASAGDVKATYSDGILEVRIPCPEAKAPEPEKVPVTRT